MTELMNTTLALGRSITVLTSSEGLPQIKTLDDALKLNYLILLGEPGSGKTFSFENASAYENGDYLTVRNYIGSNALATGSKPLFLDALDEFRTSFKDKDLIFELTRLLSSQEQKPSKFRLSCRAVDWYGDTDLQLLQRCFAEQTFAVVLLNPLRDEEIAQILNKCGFTDPVSFIQQATDKGVDSFLTNPQTLIMLTEVVKGGNWPSTKKELYAQAAKLLLTEHNKLHNQTEYAEITNEALLEAAGFVSTAILLSGTAGVSLANCSSDSDYPSYITLKHEHPHHVKASLIKRAFVCVDTDEQLVTYFHRTIAEYLAAFWLNKQVNSGYPIGRILSLLCHESTTFSELRGLYAWFTTLNRSVREMLIKRDPYGVLMYGDVSFFEISAKKYLLNELFLLSQEDPWFRSADWSAQQFGKLSSAELVDDFIDILSNEKSGFHLKSIVLDAIVNGSELDGMSSCLSQIIINPQAEQAEKNRAAEALIRVTSDGTSIILNCYRTTLILQEDSIFLRINIISLLAEFSEEQVTPKEFSKLLIEILQSKKDLAIGHLHELQNVLDIKSLSEVLDTFIDFERSSDRSWRNEYEVRDIYQAFIFRVISQTECQFDVYRIYKWLRALYILSHDHNPGYNYDVASLLEKNKPLLISLLEAAWGNLEREKRNQPNMFIYDFSQYTFGKLPKVEFVQWALEQVNSASFNDENDINLYDLAGYAIFYTDTVSLDFFEIFYNLAEVHSQLLEIRDKHCYEYIPDWRIEEAKSKAKREKLRLKDIQTLKTTRHMMKCGEHIRNLAYAVRVYFKLYSDERFKNLNSRDSLELEATKEIADDIRIGFINVLQKEEFQKLPSLDEIIAAEQKNSYPYWWYIPLAGLAELMSQDRIDDLKSEVIEVLVALYIQLIIEDKSDALELAISYIHITYPDKVRNVVKVLTDGSLKSSKKFSSNVFNYLISDKNSKPWRTDFYLELLQEVPDLDSSDLAKILKVILVTNQSLNELYKITNRVLSIPSKVKMEQRAIWLITGYLLDSELYESKLRDYAKSRAWFVWQLKDMLGATADNSSLISDINLSILVIELVGQHFRYIARPDGTTWGGDHPWEASRMVENRITQLSTCDSNEASFLLKKLINNPKLSSYSDHLKHAYSTQLKLRRDNQYNQPSWESVIETLNNGEPSSIVDLQALLLNHLSDLQSEIKFSEKDSYQLFWNTDSYGRPDNPKTEEVSRNALLVLLEARLKHQKIDLAPEAHMAADKRVDILAKHDTVGSLPIEIKRHYHDEIWTALSNQLDRFYTCHPQAKGYGIYLIIWFGSDVGNMKKNPLTGKKPATPKELKEQLEQTMSPELSNRIKVYVLDVTKQF